MTSTKYSISQAHRITGKSRTTLAKHMDDGRLSFELDRQDNRVVDASELIRVYGEQCDFDQDAASSKKPQKTKSRDVQPADQTVQAELKHVQERLEWESTERERERGQYQDQIDHLQDALKLAQEGQNKVTMLLEDRSQRAGQWERSLKGIESRLANHEQHSEKEREKLQQAKQQIAHFKRAYEVEKSKPLWQRLFQ